MLTTMSCAFIGFGGVNLWISPLHHNGTHCAQSFSAQGAATADPSRRRSYDAHCCLH